MNGIGSRIRLLAAAALLAGCVNPQNTRLPTLGYRDPRVERQSYEYHDPLPERETAKAIEVPRGFEFQRPEARRTLEKARMTEGITGTGGTSDGMSPSASRYPDSVSP